MLMLNNNKEVDCPSVGYDSTPSLDNKQGAPGGTTIHRNSVGAKPGEDKDSKRNLYAANQSAPQIYESKQELSTFSGALKLYKAQKTAFKKAENDLFALFKSRSTTRTSVKGATKTG